MKPKDPSSSGEILRLLKDKLGEDFSGIITDINRAGLVVELD
jgi:exoribonuclease R